MASFVDAALAGARVAGQAERARADDARRIASSPTTCRSSTSIPKRCRMRCSTCMSNALRYTPADKKEIAVRAVKRDKEVVITISDNGPGIPQHEQSRIFEKFYRVVDPALPDVDGTGLGLAMVHHIVRAHRGRITVQSDIGKGAAFHIFLPAASAEERLMAETVLVVEDDPSILRGLQMNLGLEGFSDHLRARRRGGPRACCARTSRTWCCSI